MDEPIKVILEKCTGCTLCVRVCPFGAIKVENKKATIDLLKCNLCGACEPACKFDAIVIAKTQTAAAAGLSQYKDVWIFAEQKKGKIQSVSYELLGEGRKLADARKARLCAVLIGSNMDSAAAELVSPGADIVYLRSED